MNLALVQSTLDLVSQSHIAQKIIFQTHQHSIWIAQFEDNLGSSFQSAWDNFIQSGQVWALIIGFIVGYVFRSITSY
ncbi:hypothetical protein [Acaryochloris sp. IP29b_bin.137]|uniref:hypothetical protein n=1 Tax=Acaryochloris sp. IP29b_bin.137 TaxID=2969217 RepID=UPI002616A021|nr:hypothetical protein [Acaryochloris sp. IP29b_bin.137]